MNDATFAQVRRKVLALHAAGDYAAALEVARAAADRYPQAADRTTYWVACLLARLGEPEAAIEALEDGSRRGLWWPPDAIGADPDLEPLRDDERFRAIVEAGRRAHTAEAARPRRDPIVRTASVPWPRAALVVLHARGQVADDVIDQWGEADDLLTIAPRSTQAFDMRTDCWDDPERADADVSHALNIALAAADVAGLPLIVAGFSQGAALALILTSRRRWRQAQGCFAVAPSAGWARQVIAEDAAPLPGLRLWMMQGTLDPRLDDAERLAEDFRARGADVRYDAIGGLGHDYPADFGVRLPTALDWILAGA